MNVFFTHENYMCVLEPVYFLKTCETIVTTITSVGLDNLEDSQIIFLGWI